MLDNYWVIPECKTHNNESKATAFQNTFENLANIIIFDIYIHLNNQRHDY